MVRSEDPHAVEGRRRALGRGQASPDHLVLPQLERDERQAARSASPSATPAQPPRSRPRASPSGPATGRPRGTHRSEREQAIPGEREEADHRRRRMGRRAQPCRPPIAAPPPPGAARPPHASCGSGAAAMLAARLPQEPGGAAWARKGRSLAPQARAAALPTAAYGPSPGAGPSPGRAPAPRPSLTVPDAFMLLPPPRPAGKERPRAPPPPVTRLPAAPPPAVLSAHWLGGERDWSRQPSVSARGGRRWAPGRQGPRGSVRARPAAAGLRGARRSARPAAEASSAAGPHAAGTGRKRPGCA